MGCKLNNSFKAAGKNRNVEVVEGSRKLLITENYWSAACERFHGPRQLSVRHFQQVNSTTVKMFDQLHTPGNVVHISWWKIKWSK